MPEAHHPHPICKVLHSVDLATYSKVSSDGSGSCLLVSSNSMLLGSFGFLLVKYILVLKMHLLAELTYPVGGLFSSVPGGSGSGLPLTTCILFGSWLCMGLLKRSTKLMFCPDWLDGKKRI